MHRTTHRARKVGDHPSAPAPDLVTKEPEVTGDPAANRAFGDDSSLGSPPTVGDRGHLDHGRITVDDTHQRRVIQVHRSSVLHESRHTLVRPAARTDDTGTCAERNPTQIERHRSVAAEGMSPLSRRTRHTNDCDEYAGEQLGTLFGVGRDLLPNLFGICFAAYLCGPLEEAILPLDHRCQGGPSPPLKVVEACRGVGMPPRCAWRRGAGTFPTTSTWIPLEPPGPGLTGRFRFGINRASQHRRCRCSAWPRVRQCARGRLSFGRKRQEGGGGGGHSSGRVSGQSEGDGARDARTDSR